MNNNVHYFCLQVEIMQQNSQIPKGDITGRKTMPNGEFEQTG